jgi:hypothetical protein
MKPGMTIVFDASMISADAVRFGLTSAIVAPSMRTVCGIEVADVAIERQERSRP